MEKKTMKRKLLKITFGLLLIFSPYFTALAMANTDGLRDSETRLVDAEVVEVTENRVAVMARTGVEHVIAINVADTKCKIGDREISLRDLRVGNIITIELDQNNPMKFAKNISVSQNTQFARNRR